MMELFSTVMQQMEQIKERLETPEALKLCELSISSMQKAMLLHEHGEERMDHIGTNAFKGYGKKRLEAMDVERLRHVIRSACETHDVHIDANLDDMVHDQLVKVALDLKASIGMSKSGISADVRVKNNNNNNIESIVLSQFKGYGAMKLSKFSEEELKTMIKVATDISKTGGHVLSPDPSKDEMVGWILNWKKNNKAPTTTITTITETEIGKWMHYFPPTSTINNHGNDSRCLRIVYFNCMNTKMVNSEFVDTLNVFMSSMEDVSVICLSEVGALRNVSNKSRLLSFVGSLPWKKDAFVFGDMERNDGERQVMILNTRLIKSMTTYSHCEKTLNYPKSIMFVPVGCKSPVLLTSLHVSPRSVNTRSSTSTVLEFVKNIRRDMDIDTEGEHKLLKQVVVGDWNMDLRMFDPELRAIDMKRACRAQVPTTVGLHMYDTFLVSSNVDTEKDAYFSVFDLVKYHNASSSVRGISDHSPVMLSLNAS